MENIKKSILEDGAFCTDDPEIGRRVNTFASNGYPFQTEEGLRLLGTVLADERVQDAVESSLENPGLGMFKVFGPHPGTARAPLNRTTDELLALTVLLCRDGSRLVLHEGSQEHELDAEPGGTGQLELACVALDRPGIKHKGVDMTDGGLIIADGRLFFTVLEGVVIGVGFAAEKELKEWGKMPWPKSPTLEQKVAEMEKSGRIRMNFKFVAVRRSG